VDTLSTPIRINGHFKTWLNESTGSELKRIHAIDALKNAKQINQFRQKNGRAGRCAKDAQRHLFETLSPFKIITVLSHRSLWVEVCPSQSIVPSVRYITIRTAGHIS